MKIKKINEKVVLPQGVTAGLDGAIVTVKGPKGEVKRKLLNKKVKIELKESSIFISADPATKREKTTIGTFKAHIKNMVKGVTEGHEYRLKVCAGHFPITVGVESGSFVVKNFLGEKIPRKSRIIPGAAIKVEGQNVIVTGIDKEAVAQMAADIEQLTKVKYRDKRIFQDGIWMISKDGKELT